MQYLMMLTFPRGEGPQEGTPEFDPRWRPGTRSTTSARGRHRVGASGLEPDTATTVRARAAR